VNAVMTAASGPGSFDQFLRWISPDRDAALKRYEEIRSKITSYFVRKACDDPDELFGETRDRVIQILAAGGNYPIPDALFYSVARKVWLEDIKKPRPEPIDKNDPPMPASDPHKEFRAGCLETCLEKMLPSERDLITGYYQGQGREKIEARRLLATQHGGENTLRIKTFRLRKWLRLCVDDCMNQRRAN
jgi:hypothetical protein